MRLATLGCLFSCAAAAGVPFPQHAVDEWVWVPIEGSVCMDGKETGVYIKCA